MSAVSSNEVHTPRLSQRFVAAGLSVACDGGIKNCCYTPALSELGLAIEQSSLIMSDIGVLRIR